MKTISNKQTIFIALLGISLAIATYKSILHYNKENKSLINIFDIEECKNKIKTILLIQKEYIGKYNYNYNFYRGK